jgi:hypothetical protein
LSRIIGPLKRKIFTQEVAENLGELIRPRGWRIVIFQGDWNNNRTFFRMPQGMLNCREKREWLKGLKIFF